MKQSDILRRVRDGNQEPIKRSHKAKSVAKVDSAIWPVRRLVTEREDLSMGQDQKQYIAGRIVGGCSLHAAEVPGRCQPNYNRCPEPRAVDCCGVADEHDIVECPRCGKQWTVPCSFDDDYA